MVRTWADPEFGVESALGWITLLMAGALLTLIVMQARSGKHPIISARNLFLAGFMDGRHEGGAGAVSTHRPAREQSRRPGHIGLRVAAVHPQRVQLQQFTRQVFVQAALASEPGP